MRIKTLRRNPKGGSTEFDGRSFTGYEKGGPDSRGTESPKSPRNPGRNSPNSSHSSCSVAERELRIICGRVRLNSDSNPPEDFDIDHVVELILVTLF
jgi:hypothetical protein